MNYLEGCLKCIWCTFDKVLYPGDSDSVGTHHQVVPKYAHLEFVNLYLHAKSPVLLVKSEMKMDGRGVICIQLYHNLINNKTKQTFRKS